MTEGLHILLKLCSLLEIFIVWLLYCILEIFIVWLIHICVLFFCRSYEYYGICTRYSKIVFIVFPSATLPVEWYRWGAGGGGAGGQPHPMPKAGHSLEMTGENNFELYLRAKFYGTYCFISFSSNFLQSVDTRVRSKKNSLIGQIHNE
jgi:hypothetical protein